MWYPFAGDIQGIKVSGDETAPPTRCWNHLYLLWFGWKHVVVFDVSEEDAQRGYKTGYVPFKGRPMINSVVRHARRFRMRIGHEDCTFCAISADSEKEKAYTDYVDDKRRTRVREDTVILTRYAHAECGEERTREISLTLLPSLVRSLF